MIKDYFNNPLKILHRLKEAGFSQKQAEAQAEVISSYATNNFITKQDLFVLEQKLLTAIKDSELKLTYRITAIIGLFYALGKFF